MTAAPAFSGTVAIVAPGGRDGAVIGGIMRTAGVASETLSVPDLLKAIASASVATAVVAEEALAGCPAGAVAEAVGAQPPWSDFPVVVLTKRHRTGHNSPVLRALRNVTEVERPVHPATLLGTVRSALRARTRQHELRTHLMARQAAEDELRALTQTLERRVEERTAALQAANELLQHEAAERNEAEARVRAVQAQLIHISRLSAMNTMGSTIAHELNQPLAAILSYMRGVERLLGRMPDVPDELFMAVGAAAGNAYRAGSVIRRLRDLVQHRAVERRPESMAMLFEEARVLGLIDGSARGVDCRLEIAPDADRVIVDGVQIQQVLINLIRNAVDAMEGSPHRLIRIAAVRRDKEQVSVTVTDTGPGWPAAMLTGGFPPFRSSKPNGLGIGLSICRTIIEDHGGSLAVANGEHGGAVVSFQLPAA